MEQVRLSDVTLDDVKVYIRAEDVTDKAGLKLIRDIMSSAKGYILSYTNLTANEIDNLPEMVIAYECLCADMYDVRTASVSQAKENPIVRNILNLHRRNLVI